MRDGEQVGWVDGSQVYDSVGRNIGYFEDEKVYSKKGDKLAYFKGDYVYFGDEEKMNLEKLHEMVSGGGQASDLVRAAAWVLLEIEKK